MSRLFYHVMQDNVGNLLFDVSGTMRLAGTGTLATIYGDEAMTVPIANPMTNHVSFGSFKCYLAPGSYDFYMAKSGYTFETLAGLQGGGTMANQNANAVAISGGTLSTMERIAINTGIAANERLRVAYNKGTESSAIFVQPLGVDAGAGVAMIFTNIASTPVGNINTSATTTSFNTTSDARLKHDVDDLTGELDVIQALRPVRFKWNADNSDGQGFLAHEVAQVLAGVITGEQDAVDDAGGIRPQMIDYSKLVPFLVGAVKSLIERVEALQARVEVLEDAAGV